MSDNEKKEKLEVYYTPAQIAIREGDRRRTEYAWLETKFFIPVNFDIIEKDEKLFADLLEEHCRRRGITQKDSTRMNLEQRTKVYEDFDADLKKKFRVQYTEANQADFEDFVKEYCAAKKADPAKISQEDKNKLFEQFDPRLRVEMQYNYLGHNSEVIELLKEHQTLHDLSVFKYVTYEQMEDIYINGTMTKEELDKLKPKIIESNDKHLNPLQFAYIADEMAKYRKINMEAAIQPQALGKIV